MTDKQKLENIIKTKFISITHITQILIFSGENIMILNTENHQFSTKEPLFSKRQESSVRRPQEWLEDNGIWRAHGVIFGLSGDHTNG